MFACRVQLTVVSWLAYAVVMCRLPCATDWWLVKNKSGLRGYVPRDYLDPTDDVALKQEVRRLRQEKLSLKVCETAHKATGTVLIARFDYITCKPKELGFVSPLNLLCDVWLSPVSIWLWPASVGNTLSNHNHTHRRPIVFVWVTVFGISKHNTMENTLLKLPLAKSLIRISLPTDNDAASSDIDDWWCRMRYRSRGKS